jgi:predicted cupin superfamily sugar epimerase
MSRDRPFEAMVERLGLKPHPEGGWYAETWREPAAADEIGRVSSGVSADCAFFQR